MSSSKDTVITIEQKRRVVHVPGIGECRVRGASMGLEERLATHYDHPLRVNYRHFVNELVAGCAEHPRLTARDVDTLPAAGRMRLVRAVASECDLDEDLRRLRGSCLGLDERVFAAKMWHYQRWMARMAEIFIGVGVAAHTELKKFSAAIAPRVQEWRERLASLLPSASPAPGARLLLKAGLGANLAALTDAGDWARRTRISGLGARFSDRLELPASGLRTRDLDATIAAQSKGFAGASLPKLTQTLDLGVAGRSSLLSPPVRHVLDSLPKGRALLSADKPFGVSVAGRSVLRCYGTRFDFLAEQVFPGIKHARAGWRDFSRYISGLSEEWRESAAFARRWENSSHWFLLSLLTLRSSRSLVGLSETELDELMLDALEEAVRDPDFIARVTEAVEGSSLLSPIRQRNLVHGLEHASDREWVEACSPLLNGLEGAFWSTARAEGIIDEHQALVSRPSKSIGSVEGLFKHLSATPAYVTFSSDASSAESETRSATETRTTVSVARSSSESRRWSDGLRSSAMCRPLANSACDFKRTW